MYLFWNLGEQSKGHQLGHASSGAMYGRLLTQDQLAVLAAQQGSTQQNTVVANDFSSQLNSASNQTRITSFKFREPNSAPLRKLSVDLIKTYKHINEVSHFNF